MRRPRHGAVLLVWVSSVMTEPGGNKPPPNASCPHRQRSIMPRKYVHSWSWIAFERDCPPVPGIFRYLEAIVRRVTVKTGSSVRRVRWEPGLRKVGGEMGVSGERYS